MGAERLSYNNYTSVFISSSYCTSVNVIKNPYQNLQHQEGTNFDNSNNPQLSLQTLENNSFTILSKESLFQTPIKHAKPPNSEKDHRNENLINWNRQAALANEYEGSKNEQN